MKKQHSASLKAKVALEALLQAKTIQELASIYEVHPTQISQWKNHLKNNLPSLFTDKRSKEKQDQVKLIAELYRQIGEQKVALDWLKKKVEFIP